MLGFGDQQTLTFPKKGVMSIAKSAIEPEDHYAIYELIGKKLLTKPYQELTEELNFLIIRDTGEKVVIFNVATLNGEIVRKLKLLGDMLAKTSHKIVSAWVYHDPSRSEYYLDQKSLEPGTMRIKKLFGFDEMSLTINDIKDILTGGSSRSWIPRPRRQWQIFAGTRPGHCRRELHRTMRLRTRVGPARAPGVRTCCGSRRRCRERLHRRRRIPSAILAGSSAWTAS